MMGKEEENKRAMTKGSLWRKVQRNKTTKANFGYQERKRVGARGLVGWGWGGGGELKRGKCRMRRKNAEKDDGMRQAGAEAAEGD